MRHKVFISYHHGNDQWYRNELIKLNQIHDIFIDKSVNTGDIDDSLSDERIREKIRDSYLRDSTVTILLVGTETKLRKHVDWELYSSMIDGKVNKKSGILVVTLPTTNCNTYTAAHDGEKELIYPDNTSWINVDTRVEYDKRYPYLPNRIIDNLLNTNAKISVTNWSRISNRPDFIKFLIDKTHDNMSNCQYDLTRHMRRKNN